MIVSTSQKLEWSDSKMPNDEPVSHMVTSVVAAPGACWCVGICRIFVLKPDVVTSLIHLGETIPLHV